MSFIAVADEPGQFTYQGLKVRFEYWKKGDGPEVEKLAIYYPEELGPGISGSPDFLRSGWPNKEQAEQSAKDRAKSVIDRKRP
ncbi:hypothetical protein [uncultured Pseudomonas sp.]|uniref:hypothetical protein n=1 Tax=uncultured Pseudomonas sp. TaxID=114707 RepID=UPI0025929F3C|nr:hypothetical protein [uncultured Pseudomonas sp.]